MYIDRLNAWMTLIANLGVVAGIVFLAIEIQQNTAWIEKNTQMARASMFREYSSSFSQFRAHTIGDAGVARIWFKGRDGGELSELDGYRFRDMAYDLFVPAAAGFMQATAVEDFGAARAIATTTASYLSCTRLKKSGT